MARAREKAKTTAKEAVNGAHRERQNLQWLVIIAMGFITPSDCAHRHQDQEKRVVRNAIYDKASDMVQHIVLRKEEESTQSLRGKAKEVEKAKVRAN